MKTLILTDHSGHSSSNSLYALARTLAADPRSTHVHVVSRGDKRNLPFFQGARTQVQGVVEVNEHFRYTPDNPLFGLAEQAAHLADYDLIWLRLPPPADEAFFASLKHLSASVDLPIVNDPAGIIETGDKQFLLNFSQLTAPSRLIDSVASLLAFANRFPIVLKPLRDYGGRGLVRIQNGQATEGEWTGPLETFLERRQELIRNGQYLGMQFLKNVDQGDKRILVAGGEILGASLRLPAPGNWLCNVSQGGTSVATDITTREKEIIATVAPVLAKHGILYFGVDTLVDDQGQRVLSELNTNSIGGFANTQKQSDRPILQLAIDALFNYVRTRPE